MEIFHCEPTAEHESPIGGGIASVNCVRWTGNVPSLKAAFNRGTGWFDDTLAAFEPGDNYNGPFPIVERPKFAAIPGRTFLLKFYGTWSDGGTPREFSIQKNCTAKQTQILYFNAYDRYPNVTITITWDKEYEVRNPQARLWASAP